MQNLRITRRRPEPGTACHADHLNDQTVDAGSVRINDRDGGKGQDKNAPGPGTDEHTALDRKSDSINVGRCLRFGSGKREAIKNVLSLINFSAASTIKSANKSKSY